MRRLFFLLFAFLGPTLNVSANYGGEKTPVNRVNIRSKYMDDHGNVNPIMMSQIPCKTFSSVLYIDSNERYYNHHNE